jgi:uncharacterized protein YbdZ (MbtH family)
MENQRYKLLQFSTIGWEEVHSNLTKEECMRIIESNIAEGVNPNHLKVQLDDNF